MSEVMLAIGTRKGLFLAKSRSGRSRWDVDPLRFTEEAVYAVGIDTRRPTPRVFAGVQSWHFGPAIPYSDDLGATWREHEQTPIRFPEHAGETLTRVWQLQPGPVGEPDVVYAGVEPSALFRSDDGGETFSLVEGLWNHPHRPRWEAGFGGQSIHSVLPHPDDAKTVTVAMSTGGVYRTTDGGATWAPANTGIKAYFLPNQYPEFGQCVHRIAMHPTRPDRMYAQNHGGVYRTDDAGSWTSIADGLPAEFGFPIVVHPHRPDTVYLFPLVADSERMPPERRCRVYRSDDGGGSWRALVDGLPQQGFHSSVLRDAMCADDADPAGVYFGTRDGEVYASRDEGESWTLVARHLPDVLSVRAAVI